MPLHLTKQLSRALQDDSSKCVLFVGAGLSASGIRQAGNGLPDWDTLMQHMIDDLRDSEKCDVGTLAKLGWQMGSQSILSSSVVLSLSSVGRLSGSVLLSGSHLD